MNTIITYSTIHNACLTVSLLCLYWVIVDWVFDRLASILIVHKDDRKSGMRFTDIHKLEPDDKGTRIIVSLISEGEWILKKTIWNRIYTKPYRFIINELEKNKGG